MNEIMHDLPHEEEVTATPLTEDTATPAYAHDSDEPKTDSPSDKTPEGESADAKKTSWLPPLADTQTLKQPASTPAPYTPPSAPYVAQARPIPPIMPSTTAPMQPPIQQYRSPMQSPTQPRMQPFVEPPAQPPMQTFIQSPVQPIYPPMQTPANPMYPPVMPPMQPMPPVQNPMPIAYVPAQTAYVPYPTYGYPTPMMPPPMAGQAQVPVPSQQVPVQVPVQIPLQNQGQTPAQVAPVPPMPYRSPMQPMPPAPMPPMANGMPQPPWNSVPPQPMMNISPSTMANTQKRYVSPAQPTYPPQSFTPPYVAPEQSVQYVQNIQPVQQVQQAYYPPQPSAPFAPATQAVDTTRPLVVFANEKPNETEQKQVRSFYRSVVNSIWWLPGIALIFVLGSFFPLLDLGSLYAVIVIGAELLVLGVSTWLYFTSLRKGLRSSEIIRKITSNDVVVELYEDRIIHCMEHQHFTIAYADIVQIKENATGLFIMDRYGKMMVFLGSQLCPYDAQMMKSVIYSRTPKAKRLFQATMQALRPVPLPIPVIDRSDEVLLEMHATKPSNSWKWKSFLTNMIVFVPYCTIVSISIWANNLESIQNHLLFSGCTLVLFLLAVSLVYWLTMRKKTSPFPQAAAFTQKGFALCLNGAEVLRPWPFLKIKRIRRHWIVSVQVEGKVIDFYKIPRQWVSDEGRLQSILTEHGIAIQ